MSATLPAIARWVEATPSGVSWLGIFYGGNIGGAVLGTLAAGFYLLRVHDIRVATFVAAALNFGVAALALLLMRFAHYGGGARPGDIQLSSKAWPVYLAILLSGATALAAEVLWARHLSLFIGATVYGFALILAVFLFGLGVGSAVAARLAANVESPGTALGVVQLLLCIAMAWAAYQVTQALPYWNVQVPGDRPWLRLRWDLLRAGYAMLPAALLWGASFPLALAAAADGGRDAGRLVGGLYAANTFGAIIGALGGSLLLIPLLGSRLSQQALIVASAASAALMLSTASRASRGLARIAIMGVVPVVGGAAALSVRPIIPEVIAYGRYLPGSGGSVDVLHSAEGLTAAIAVTRYDGVLQYHNSGKVQASALPQDMRFAADARTPDHTHSARAG